MAKRLTPSQAIRSECCWCMGGVERFVCSSQVCKLNDKPLTPLRRIKAHCLDCVETKQEVRDCTGRLLLGNRLCLLHPFRVGGSRIKAKFSKTSRVKHRVKPSKNDSECLQGGILHV